MYADVNDTQSTYILSDDCSNAVPVHLILIFA